MWGIQVYLKLAIVIQEEGLRITLLQMAPVVKGLPVMVLRRGVLSKERDQVLSGSQQLQRRKIAQLKQWVNLINQIRS